MEEMGVAFNLLKTNNKKNHHPNFHVFLIKIWWTSDNGWHQEEGLSRNADSTPQDNQPES